MNAEQFDYLKAYPKVHDTVLEVHWRMEMQDWEVAVQKMRTALQYMVDCIFSMYWTQTQSSLNERITALLNAQIITRQSASAYYYIKNRGNVASHESVHFGAEEAENLYACLLEETLVFADGYMRFRIEDGNTRLAGQCA